MSACYEISVLTDFAASHIIHGHPGKCARLHGHNWKVETTVVLQDGGLNEIGIGVDFKDLKLIVREVIDLLEHRHLNDIPPFDKINPTAENISKWIYNKLEEIFSKQGVELSAIALWENDRSCVRYKKN